MVITKLVSGIQEESLRLRNPPLQAPDLGALSEEQRLAKKVSRRADLPGDRSTHDLNNPVAHARDRDGNDRALFPEITC